MHGMFGTVIWDI
jgi:hypothetical protein